MLENGYPYLLNLLIGVDQLVNAIAGGSCDETLSSRTYRMARVKGGGWAVFEMIINTIFFSDVDSAGHKHCELSYMVEMSHGHMPKSLTKMELMSVKPINKT